MANDNYNMFSNLQKDIIRFLNHLKDSQRILPDFVIDVWKPNMNIYEGETKYIVMVELPGVDSKRMKIIVDGDRLNISGNRSPESQISGTKCLHMEIISGAFKRSIQLPGPVNSKNVQAEYHDGILHIMLEKLSQQPASVEIPITTETHGGAK